MLRLLRVLRLLRLLRLLLVLVAKGVLYKYQDNATAIYISSIAKFVIVCSQARFGLSVGGPVGAGTPVAITDVGRPLHFDSAIRTNSLIKTKLDISLTKGIIETEYATLGAEICKRFHMFRFAR